MAAFGKIHDDYTTLTETEKVALFKTTSSTDEATITDLETIQKFKVLKYTEE